MTSLLPLSFFAFVAMAKSLEGDGDLTNLISHVLQIFNANIWITVWMEPIFIVLVQTVISSSEWNLPFLPLSPENRKSKQRFKIYISRESRSDIVSCHMFERINISISVTSDVVIKNENKRWNGILIEVNDIYYTVQVNSCLFI